MEITEEITQKMEQAQATADALKDENKLREVIENAAAHAKLRSDNDTMKKLNRLKVPMYNADGSPRLLYNILVDAGVKMKERAADTLRCTGQLLFRAKEKGNLRILPSGALYTVSANGQWHRLKGKAAIEATVN